MSALFPEQINPGAVYVYQYRGRSITGRVHEHDLYNSRVTMQPYTSEGRLLNERHLINHSDLLDKVNTKDEDETKKAFERSEAAAKEQRATAAAQKRKQDTINRSMASYFGWSKPVEKATSADYVSGDTVRFLDDDGLSQYGKFEGLVSESGLAEITPLSWDDTDNIQEGEKVLVPPESIIEVVDEIPSVTETAGRRLMDYLDMD